MTPKSNVITDITTLSRYIIEGKTLLYPTDTIWGIGCDATNEIAVGNVFKMKERAASKSVVILVENIEMIEKFIGKLSQLFIDSILNSDRPTTFVVNNHFSFLPPKVVSSQNTVAVRIPNHKFCLALLNKMQRPLVSTSANISGIVFPKKYEDIEGIIKNRVDYIAPQDYDTSKIIKPSRIIGFDNDKIIVIRE